MMKLVRIKSVQLLKAIIKTIKKLKELVLEDHGGKAVHVYELVNKLTSLVKRAK